MYTPFGEFWVEEVSEVDIDHITRFFTNQQYDKESGLYYMNARYYDPHLGSFISPDPAMANLNHYAYASANPIKYTDPTGLDDSGDGHEWTNDNYDTGRASDTDGVYDGNNYDDDPGMDPGPGLSIVGDYVVGTGFITSIDDFIAGVLSTGSGGKGGSGKSGGSGVREGAKTSGKGSEKKDPQTELDIYYDALTKASKPERPLDEKMIKEMKIEEQKRKNAERAQNRKVNNIGLIFPDLNRNRRDEVLFKGSVYEFIHIVDKKNDYEYVSFSLISDNFKDWLKGFGVKEYLNPDQDGYIDTVLFKDGNSINRTIDFENGIIHHYDSRPPVQKYSFNIIEYTLPEFYK